MVLRSGFLTLALKLQEASDLGASDVRIRLSDAISDAHRGTGNWAYYIDHFGDGDSGDVIYSCNGDMKRAPYEITSGTGAAKCVIDMENALDVVPRTIYEVEQDEADHYATMEESFKGEKLYKDLPLYERFIGKSERAKATTSDFAGKGRSFPILKADDVMAAVHSMERAGSANHDPTTLKSRIISIAKKKGFESNLPKSWRTAPAKEASSVPIAGEASLKLVESTAFPVDLELRETFGGGRKIKLIAPGKGSTAFYTAEVLKRDGPLVFTAGTPMRIDHPTQQEAAARPEGSVKDWGAVLEKNAYWLDEAEAGSAGAGLFSEIKAFSDHAQTIEEKGPYAGVSICAYGEAARDANGKIITREGVPVLAKLTSADGVDMVTRAGAGGMFLSEAARSAANLTQEHSDMDAAELKKLQESVATQTAINTRLLERALRGDARVEAARILKTNSLAEPAKERVIEAVTRDFASIPQTDGALDLVKFTEAVNAAAKAEGAYVASLVGSGRVNGMGSPAPAVAAPAVTAQEAATAEADRKRLREAAVRSFTDLGMPRAAAEAAVGQEAA